MSKFSLNRLIGPFLPFLVLGIAIALIIGISILLSYVFLWGLVIGGILWVISRVRAYFNKNTLPTTDSHKKGRTFEHHD